MSWRNFSSRDHNSNIGILFREWVSVSHKQLSMSIEWVGMSLKKYFQKISSMSKVIFFDRFR